MNSNNKLFKKFLISKKSNFISHAISKIHNTYDQNNDIQKFNFFFQLKDKLFFLLDIKNFFIKKKKSYDVVIISNIILANKLGEDLYFGNIPKKLEKKKIKTLTIFRNHTNILSNDIKKFIKRDTVLLSKRVDYSIEISIFLTAIKEYFIYIFFNKYSSLKNLLTIKDFFSIIPNLRLIYQLKKLLEITKPKAIIFTYEGHAWERLLIKSCKKFDNKIKVIAYQFSIVKKNQIGFFRKLKTDYNPDYIATTGSIPYENLKKKIKFSKIFKLGSPKHVKRLKTLVKTNDLLVALPSEKKKLNDLLDFSTQFAIKNNDFNIILRPHPILENNLKLINKIKIRVKKIHNISLSNNKLELDLKISRYLLYLDSAICITGLNYDVIPLFFKHKKNLNIFDNKFPVENIIQNETNLKEKLKIKKNLNRETYFEHFRNNYFEKINLNNLKKIIKR